MKLAIFDIDGTLVQPHPREDWHFVEAIRAALGIDDVDSNWAEYEHVTDSGLADEIIRRSGGIPNEESVGRFRERYCTQFLAELSLHPSEEIPGAVDFLESLVGRRDWRVALATGNFRSVAEQKLRGAGFRAGDLPMATADEVISRTDLLAHAETAAREINDGVPFEHVVSVGDAPWDRAAASTVGIPFLAVGRRCGGGKDRSISDYRDQSVVMRRMSEAIPW